MDWMNKVIIVHVQFASKERALAMKSSSTFQETRLQSDAENKWGPMLPQADLQCPLCRVSSGIRKANWFQLTDPAVSDEEYIFSRTAFFRAI